MEKVTRRLLLPWAETIVDDAQGVIEMADPKVADSLKVIDENCWMFGWQADTQLIAVVVKSHLPGVKLEETEAQQLAMDYMVESGTFASWDLNMEEPDYVSGPVGGETVEKD